MICPYLVDEKRETFQAVTMGMVLFLFFGSQSVYAESLHYDSGGRRDPFIPLVTADGAVVGNSKKIAGDLKVEGIIYDPNEGSYALINGKFYKEGDEVEQAKLISIFKDRVLLSVNDAEKVLWLREEIANK